jgi:hypothetical protein
VAKFCRFSLTFYKGNAQSTDLLVEEAKNCRSKELNELAEPLD